jgi:cobaltochelatase CobS
MLETILVRKDYPLAETFGLDSNKVDESIKVAGYDIPDPASLPDPLARQHAEFLRAAIPEVDPMYEFRQEVVSDIFNWWIDDDGRDVLMLWGPTGVGKTSVFDQWCARLGVPRFALKGHKMFEAHEAFGHYIAGPNGETVYAPGPVTLAAQYGLPCITNEYDRIQPSRSIVFNDVFESRAFPMPGKHGEMLVPRHGFRNVITTNTNMVEDVTGNYGTAAAHDVSLLERIVGIHVGYPERETEQRLLAKVLAPFDDDLLAYWLDQEGAKLATSNGTKSGAAISRGEFIDGLIEVAHKIRAQSKDGGNTRDEALERSMSPRILRKWARQTLRHASMPEKHGKSALHTALRKYLSSTATESTRIALHEAVKTVFCVDETIESS